MNLTRPILTLALAAHACCHAANAEPLQLTASAGGESFSVTAVDAIGTPLLGPDRRPAPPATTWVLSGDIRAASAQLRWSPVYTIERADERAARLTPDKPYRARVQVRHVPSLDGARPRQLQPLLMDWPGGLPAGGLAVIVWLVDREPVEVAVVPLPSTDKESRFGFAKEFALTAEHAERGQPVLLLWRDGAIAEPAPQFSDAALQRAFVAVRLDDAAALQQTLPAQARIDAVSRDGHTLLHYAAECGASACLETLLKRRGVDKNQTDQHQFTPLQYASELGRTAAVQALLESRADVHAFKPSSPPALPLAIQAGHIPVVDALLAKRAATGKTGQSFNLMRLALDRGYAEIADRLLKARVPWDFKSQNSGRHLLLAAMRGHLAVVRWLVDQGTDPNTEIGGATALGLAASAHGDAEAARALLEAGAKVDVASKSGVTPLIAAAGSANVDYARALLEAGASPQARTENGVTPLHYAAHADSAELVALLLERGAELAATAADGTTPLESALAASAPEAARVLVSRGATINLGHPEAELFLAAAVRHDIAEIVEAALREGWPAHSTFAGTWPAARVAEIFKSQRTLDVLVSAGASAPDADAPMPLATGRELDQALKVERPAPVIDPRGADEAFPETQVRMSVLIDAEGRPLFPSVVDSPDPRLRLAALQSISNSRFGALRRQGKPVAVRVQIPVTFAGSEERVFELDRLSQPPLPVSQAAPVYPYELKKRGITGRVELTFTVDAEGRVRDVVVIRATHPAFGEAGAAAIRQWKFRPGSIDGRPVPARMRQPLSFALNP